MNICFVLSRINQPAFETSSRRITGREWALDIIESEADGLYYPHIADHTDSTSYRFFAGRIAGVKPSSELPQGHPVTKSPAEDWSFSGDEPGGSWLALKFDRQIDVVSITSDVFLLQRWYYTQQEDRWYFSNSLQFLQQNAEPRLEIDERSIPYMLVLGYMPFRYTPLKNVFGFLPGQSISIVKGKLRIDQRAQLPYESLTHRVTRVDDAALRNRCQMDALEVIRESVAIELEHLDTVTIPISGGMDSRFALGCALEVMPKDRILTYTYGHPNYRDFQIGTGLAEHLGLRNIPVPMDNRPLEEILVDGFQISEGMKLAFPNFPIGPLSDVMPHGTHILSGYFGETIWGQTHISESKDFVVKGDLSNHLYKLIWSLALQSPIDRIQKIIKSNQWDSFGWEKTIRALPGTTIDEKFSRWYAGDRYTNMVSFAVQMRRNNAFFLAPHANAQVVKFAFGMPIHLRRDGSAYYSAMKVGFPDLYRYPTTRNFGYSLEKNVKWRKRILRRWWKLLSEIEKQVFRFTGEIYFHPPIGRQYSHPLELNRKIHRASVLNCLEELKPMSILDPKGIAALRDDYYHRRPYPSPLLRSLITVQQWQKHYMKD